MKIDASNFFERLYLEVEADGIKFSQPKLTNNVRRFRFTEIECVLMSSEHKLSFQVGREVFSIPTKENHRKIVEDLVSKVRQAHGQDPNPTISQSAT